MNKLLTKQRMQRGQSSVEFVAYLPMLAIFVVLILGMGEVPFALLRSQNINYSQCMMVARRAPQINPYPDIFLGYDVASTPPDLPSVSLWGNPGLPMSMYPHTGDSNCITLLVPRLALYESMGYIDGVRNDYYVATSPFINCGDNPFCSVQAFPGLLFGGGE